MSIYVKHFQETDKASYGMKFAIGVSLVLHIVFLFGMYMAGVSHHRLERPTNAITVKLGGPNNLQQSGQKRKAPVAGVQKPRNKPVAKKTNSTKKKPPPKKKKPAPNKNQIGLDTKKKNTKKTQPQPEEVASDPSDQTPILPPEDDKGPRALGGFGNDGIGVTEAGDGNAEITEEDVEFITYFRSIREELSNHWVKTGLAGGTTRVKFHIMRDGSVSEVRVVESAGRSFLDGPAQRAVMASDFPPLPQGYRGEKLIVTINFRYEGQ